MKGEPVPLVTGDLLIQVNIIATFYVPTNTLQLLVCALLVESAGRGFPQNGEVAVLGKEGRATWLEWPRVV